MNLQTAWLVPWRSCRTQMRWMAVIILALCLLGAVAIVVFHHKVGWQPFVATLFGLGEAFFWAFWMSTTTLLAIDAHQLRIPQLKQQVVLSLVLYGLLSVLIPTLVFGLLGADMVNIGALLALFCVGGYLVALLPRFLSTPLCFLPMALQALPASFHIGGPSSANFAFWAWPLCMVLVGVAAICWRGLMRSADPYETGLGKPMVVQFRSPTRSAMNSLTGITSRATDSTQQIRGRPAWMQPRADLRRSGPRYPVRSLRVALGGLYLPLTIAGRLRQLATIVLPSLLVVVLLQLQSLQRGESLLTAAFWHGAGIVALVWLGVFGSIMLSAFTLTPLQQRWQKTNAELPLLALLPGLSGVMPIKRELLKAILMLPLLVQGALLVALITLGRELDLQAGGLLLLALSQVGTIGFMLAFTLSTIGGKPLSGWVTGLISAFGYALITLSLFVPTFNKAIFETSDAWSFALAIAWATLIVTLLWLARRGWSGLQQRPHPFLPN